MEQMFTLHLQPVPANLLPCGLWEIEACHLTVLANYFEMKLCSEKNYIIYNVSLNHNLNQVYK